MEVIWNIITTIINNRLRTAIWLHDYLYDFSQGWGMGVTTLAGKLVQQLSGICHKPLLRIFLDVKKAYNSLDQARLMETLQVYGLGKNPQRPLERFWEGHTVATRAGGYNGFPFNTYLGVNQWGPVSHTIFNIVVDGVVWDMLMQVCGSQEYHRGLGWASGEQDIVFYANDVRIAGRNPI